jgi:hypothetical protein
VASGSGIEQVSEPLLTGLEPLRGALGASTVRGWLETVVSPGYGVLVHICHFALSFVAHRSDCRTQPGGHISR